MTATIAPPLLEVRNLAVHFPFSRGPLFRREHGAVRAVDGVSFTIRESETLGLVGESGCGKSTTARAIMHLVPSHRRSNPAGAASKSTIFPRRRCSRIVAICR